MLKKSVICATMLSVVVFVLASSGGGKKKSAIPTPAFAPVRSMGIFTLKLKPEYAGSRGFSKTRNENSILYRSVVTYQKGNTIYVLPSSYRISSGSKTAFRSNLNLLDLKIRLKK